MFNSQQAQQSIPPQPRIFAAGRLLPQHRDHFRQDGWEDAEIEQAIAWGVRSVSQGEARRLLGYTPPSGGIWFPFADGFGQLRPDDRRYSNGNESPKYCSPKRDTAAPTYWSPPGHALSDCSVVTEGWKDAAIATIRSGQPVAALAGVSHYRKLPQGCGLSLLFDSDALGNAGVMGALIKGAFHTGGKIAIIPAPPEAKAGCTEYFGGGATAADFARLVADAQPPADMLRRWLAYLGSSRTIPKGCEDAIDLYQRILRIASGDPDPESSLWIEIRPIAARLLNSLLAADQVRGLSNAPIGEFGPLPMPPAGERRLVILNGQKGTAKTSQGIKGAVDDAKLHKKPAATYAPTRFLSRDTSERLQTICHLDKESEAAAFVTTCPESSHKLADRDWPVLVIDEANEVLPRSWEGNLGQSPSKARAALADQIGKAQLVVLAQDGIYQPVIEAAIRLGKFSPSEIEYIDLRRQPTDMEIRLYEGSGDGGCLDLDYHGWLAQLIAAIGRGERVAIPSGSRGKGRQIHRLLRRLFPDKKGFCIDGRDSFAGMRSQFAESPDGWIAQHQPDWLIFTPVFNSGVSIQRPYFTAQFEYSSPRETATAASQRGERVRAAIGGGLIKARHIFLQRRGMPSSPPLEVLSPEYWRAILSGESSAQDAIATLRSAGLQDAADRLAAGHKPPIADYPELAAVLAIQARETHLKAECLRAEWEGNGWDILAGEQSSEDQAKDQAELCAEIYESDLGTRARALAKAPSQAEALRRHLIGIARDPSHAAAARQKLAEMANGRAPREGAARQQSPSLAAWRGGQEPGGPIEAVRQQRWDMEDRLGAIALLSNPEFWAATIENRDAIGQAQLAAALRLQWEHPDIWAQIQQWRALRVVALSDYYAPLVGDIPALPASQRVLSLAALLGKCPGLRDAISGQMSKWDLNTPQVIAAAKWARENAGAIAALTKNSQRIMGFQFTDRTPAAAAFHRLLEMFGAGGQHCGQEGKIHQYRLATAADVAAAIKKATAADKPMSPRRQRELWLAQHRGELVAAALEVAMLASGPDKAAAWDGIRATIAGAIPPTQNFSSKKSITEVLCSPPDTQYWRYTGSPWGGLDRDQRLSIHSEQGQHRRYQMPDGTPSPWIACDSPLFELIAA